MFIDRDGVLNEPLVRDGLPYPPEAATDLRLLPRIAESCASLRAAGLALIVVTNQPDIARGTVDPAVVDSITVACGGSSGSTKWSSALTTILMDVIAESRSRE